MKVFVPTATSAPDANQEYAFRLLALLLQTIEKNLIRSKALNTDMLAYDLNALLSGISRKLPEREMVPLCAESAKSLEAYFKGFSSNLDALGTDLQLSIRSLTQVAQSVLGAQTEFMRKLQRMEFEFRDARSLDDIHQLRERLDAFLHHLREEVASNTALQKEQQERLTQASAEAEQLAAQVTPSAASDPNAGPAVTLIRIRRLSQFRERYGLNVSQQIRDYIVQLLMARWPSELDCRFYPPECFAIVDAKTPDIELHKHLMRRIAAERIVYNAKVQEREVLLQITLDWTVTRIADEAQLADVIPAFLKHHTQIERRPAPLDPFN